MSVDKAKRREKALRRAGCSWYATKNADRHTCVDLFPNGDGPMCPECRAKANYVRAAAFQGLPPEDPATNPAD